MGTINIRLIPTLLNEDVFIGLDRFDKPTFHLTFFDPPFLQGKDYRHFNDDQSPQKYWWWIYLILKKIYTISEEGASIYFMQREKNVQKVVDVLKSAKWTFQNLIIWKKMTSPVPQKYRFGKQYQVIVFATKGIKPLVFNRLRIDKPLESWQKIPRNNGVYVTDIWDDIRELTSGYFAGNEPFYDSNNKRIHTQQSPIQLLLRIILSSSLPNHLILDPMTGTGTTLNVAQQLKRKSLGIEIDQQYFSLTKKRLSSIRSEDDIEKEYNYYRFTNNLNKIWGK